MRKLLIALALALALPAPAGLAAYCFVRPDGLWATCSFHNPDPYATLHCSGTLHATTWRGHALWRSVSFSVPPWWTRNVSIRAGHPRDPIVAAWDQVWCELWW